MIKRLEQRTVNALKPAEKDYDVWDENEPGLGVHVFPSGVKSWTFRYRIGKRQRRLRLGSANLKETSLAEAREKAREARRDVEAGRDPQEHKQQRRLADTVGEFAEIYLAEYAIGPGGEASPRKRSWKNDRAMLKHDVLPKWKHRRMEEITRRDVRELLESIAKRGPILANRVRSLLSKIFKFAMTKDIVEANPVLGTVRPGQEQVRDRFLTDDEIRTFYATLEPLTALKRALWTTMLLTGRRPGEVPDMRWEEVDLDTGWWNVPGSTMKHKRPHMAPLPKTVVGLLRDLAPAADGFVFENVRGTKQQRVVFPIPDFTAKDLQKTVSTHMRKGGVPRDIVDKVLGHLEPGIIRHYDHHDYAAEKQAAVAWWAARVEQILKNDNAAKVLPFARQA